eukprot:TRINITY_DN81591_c0_g1_i1.p1 TRINITY_DN81591_c0_g1~~TRINITY_DN81591_c0_g1_i1.p1  ORF type:complete len:263 (+),score=48.32 TRINITY_DN81591_c0_g1_i1:26-790(+)
MGSYLSSCVSRESCSGLFTGAPPTHSPEICTEIVMLDFRSTVLPSQIAELEARAVAMCLKIREVASMTMFKDLKLKSGQKHPAGRNRDFCIISTFDCAADYDAYLSHPAYHKLLTEVLAPLTEPGSRAALQYGGRDALYKKHYGNVTHVEMISSHESLTQDQMQALRDRGEKMKQSIPQIREVGIYKDLKLTTGAKLADDKKPDLCFILTFGSAEDYDIYAAHEERREMFADNAPIMEKGSRLAIQFAKGEKII